MLVFIDQTKREVICAKPGMTAVSVPWEDINSITNILRGKNVTYVTSAEIANGDDIISLLSSLQGQARPVPKKTGMKFVHSLRGQVVIHHGEKDILFGGPDHFIPLSDLGGQSFIDECASFKIALKHKKLEIIDESEIPALRSSMPKKKSPIEIHADNIIVDARAKDVADGLVDDEDNAVNIDITDEVVSGGNEDESLGEDTEAKRLIEEMNLGSDNQ